MLLTPKLLPNLLEGTGPKDIEVNISYHNAEKVKTFMGCEGGYLKCSRREFGFILPEISRMQILLIELSIN